MKVERGLVRPLVENGLSERRDCARPGNFLEHGTEVHSGLKRGKIQAWGSRRKAAAFGTLMTESLALFETSGYSMEPLLRQGDRIVVAPVPMSELSVGDMVLAEIDGRKVCHRLVGIKQQGGGLVLLLRGDASFSEPDAVSSQAYLGRVSAIIKPGHTLSLDTPSARLFSKIAIWAFPPFMIVRRVLGRLTGRV